MHFTTKFYYPAKLFLIFLFALALISTGLWLRNKGKPRHRAYNKIQEFDNSTEYESLINATASEPKKTRRKEYLYRLLTNTTRSLIQIEIKARRLEENMRRITEKTADLLWKNKDKALWHILFKNISRHISIRHEFHQHSSLRRIMQDNHSHAHKHKVARRKVLLRR